MSEIASRFDDNEPFQGASVIFGRADLLVELAGNTLDAVSEPVLSKIREAPGVLWTDTAFVYSGPWRAQP